MNKTKCEKRINSNLYNDIFNDISKIKDLDRVTFDMSIDLINDLITNMDGKNGWNSKSNKETITFGFINYLFEIFNSYLKLLTGSHRSSIMIINRTVVEIYIKLKYLLYKDDEKLYENFIKESLVTEKLYLKDIDNNYSEVSENFKKGTRESILKLQKDSKVENLEELSKKKILFPKIEIMAKELINNNIIPRATYEIVYRTQSSYSHANWSAIQMQAFRENNKSVNTELMAPNSIMIIDLFLYINNIFDKMPDEFIKDLTIYSEAFYKLNEEDLIRKKRI
jgi:hypothetical protein